MDDPEDDVVERDQMTSQELMEEEFMIARRSKKMSRSPSLNENTLVDIISKYKSQKIDEPVVTRKEALDSGGTPEPVVTRNLDSAVTPELLEQDRKRKSPSTPITNKGNYVEAPDMHISVNEIAIIKEIMKYVDKIAKDEKKLSTLIANNVNTKKEIKECAARMSSQIGYLSSEETKKCLKKIEKYLLLDKEKVPQKHSNEQQQSESVDEDVKKLNMEINSAQNMTQLIEIINKPWPEKMYKKTQIKTGNMVLEPERKDIIILPTTVESLLETGIYRAVQSHFPDIRDDGNAEEKGVNFITQIVRTHKNKEIQQKERFIFKHIIDTVNEKTIMERVREVFSVFVKEKRKKVNIPVISNFDILQFRKIIEITLFKYDVEADIYVPHNLRTKSTYAEATTYSVKKPQDNELILELDNSDFPALMQKVKKAINPSQIGVEIKSVRQISSGRAIVTVNNGKNSADLLKRELNNKLLEIITKTFVKTKVLHVKYLDCETTEKDVKEVLKDLLKVDERKIEVRALRNTWDKNKKNVTVVLPEKDAQALINQKYIRVGWANWKIIEHDNMLKCSRCWEAGHNKFQCSGTDRELLCLKCAQPGHTIKNCQNRPLCVFCLSKDHRSGDYNQSCELLLNITVKLVCTL